MDGLPGHNSEDPLVEPILILEPEWEDAEDSYNEALSDLNEWEDYNERLDSLIEDNEDLQELDDFDYREMP